MKRRAEYQWHSLHARPHSIRQRWTGLHRPLGAGRHGRASCAPAFVFALLLWHSSNIGADGCNTSKV